MGKHLNLFVETSRGVTTAFLQSKPAGFFRRNQMGKGNSQRHQGGKNEALRDALTRADNSGNFIATVKHDEDFPRQVTDPVEVTRLCFDILEGTPGVYEIFGAKFQVEPHPAVDFPVIRFVGGLPECEVREEIRLGYFIPVSKLLPNPEKMHYNSEMEEIFVAFLLSQDEMKLAKNDFFRKQNVVAEARAEQDAAEAEEVRQQKLAKIRGAASTKPQPLVLSRLADILTANFATFNHESGVTLVVCRGFHDYTVVRPKNASENHPLYQQEQENVFVVQEQLFLPGENEKELQGKSLLARQMREWLRGELRAVGALPPALEIVEKEATSSMTEVDKEHAVALDVHEDEPVAITTKGKRPTCFSRFRKTIGEEAKAA